LTVHREKMVFHFKALFCIFLIALWSFWFSYFSKENRQKKIIRQPAQTKKVIDQNIVTKIAEKKKPLSDSKITSSTISKEKKNLQNNLVKELPKLAILTPVKINKEISMPETEIRISKAMINLNLPNIASATRKALITQEALPTGQISLLRKGIKIEKDKLKPALIYLKNEADILDTIAEQIELAGIVNKPNGESTVIIRNKSNNYIEILRKGDEYQGLKLLEINKSEVVLRSDRLNKTYIKKINTGEEP